MIVQNDRGCLVKFIQLLIFGYQKINSQMPLGKSRADESGLKRVLNCNARRFLLQLLGQHNYIMEDKNISMRERVCIMDGSRSFCSLQQADSPRLL